ncbi:hypothetical protein K9L97_02885 [Candidatus Woesearchaeota archaeon]|nr:hypothetical protein [Candidatus Woesearchaeota archaeon]
MIDIKEKIKEAKQETYLTIDEIIKKYEIIKKTHNTIHAKPQKEKKEYIFIKINNKYKKAATYYKS